MDGIFANFIPLLKILAAKPVTSPVIPPPKEIKTSFLEKFLFNKTSRILLTLLIFLFFSLALKNNTKILLFLKDLLIFEINFFGTFLSTTIKHLSKSIEFDFVYNLIQRKINFDNVKIDSSTNSNLDKFIEKFNKQKNFSFNRVRFTNFVKNVFDIYAG